MKKVAALTNDLKNRNNLISNIVDSGIVKSEDDIVIINIKKSQIDIINDDRCTMVINAALGAVISYIKHAKYVYIDGRYMLNNHLVQYLLTFTKPEQVINEHLCAYKCFGNTKYVPKPVCDEFYKVYSGAYEDLINMINDQFDRKTYIASEFMDLMWRLTDQFHMHLDDSIEYEYEEYPDSGIFKNITNVECVMSDESNIGSISFYYTFAHPVSYVRTEEEIDADYEPCLVLRVDLCYDYDVIEKLKYEHTTPVLSEDDHNFKLDITLMMNKDFMGVSLMRVEIPLDKNMVTYELGTRTTVCDENWKTTLKDNGYSDEVIDIADRLMIDFMSDKFFMYI